MIRGFLALAGCFAVLAVACGDDGDDSAASTATVVSEATAQASCSSVRPADAGDSNVSVSSGGFDRTYILHVPSGYDGMRRTPIVFAFHGLSHTAEIMRELTALNAAADERGFIVVYPDGTGTTPAWNVDDVISGPDDTAFFTEVLDSLSDSLARAHRRNQPGRIDLPLVHGGGADDRVPRDSRPGSPLRRRRDVVRRGVAAGAARRLRVGARAGLRRPARDLAGEQ
jgi:hypothetical protein